MKIPPVNNNRNLAPTPKEKRIDVQRVLSPKRRKTVLKSVVTQDDPGKLLQPCTEKDVRKALDSDILRRYVNMNLFWNVFTFSDAGMRRSYTKTLIEALEVLAFGDKGDSFENAMTILCAVIDAEIDRNATDLMRLSQITWGLSRPILCNIAEDSIEKRKLISTVAHTLMIQLIVKGDLDGSKVPVFSFKDRSTSKIKERITTQLYRNIFHVFQDDDERIFYVNFFLDCLEDLSFGERNIKCFSKLVSHFYSLIDSAVTLEERDANILPALTWGIFSAVYASECHTIDVKAVVATGAKRMLEAVVKNTIATYIEDESSDS